MHRAARCSALVDVHCRTRVGSEFCTGPDAHLGRASRMSRTWCSAQSDREAFARRAQIPRRLGHRGSRGAQAGSVRTRPEPTPRCRRACASDPSRRELRRARRSDRSLRRARSRPSAIPRRSSGGRRGRARTRSSLEPEYSSWSERATLAWLRGDRTPLDSCAHRGATYLAWAGCPSSPASVARRPKRSRSRGSYCR